jgi:transcriptional regulator GlxA family with amidase domain
MIDNDMPMKGRTMAQPKPRPVLFEFVLMDAFSMMSVISAIEPLRVANRMGGHEFYAWTIKSEDGGAVRASNGLVLASEGRIGEGPRPDYCIVCAGISLVAAHPARLSAFLNRRYSEGTTLGAVSLGPVFLARAGLLKGKRATIHWEGRPAFKEEFPDIPVSRAIYEIDGQIMTCAGGMSSFDLTMEIIARDHDPKLVQTIANQLQRDRVRAGVTLQSAGTEHISDVAPEIILRAVAMLAETMETPMTPNELADELGVSRRTLERMFVKYTGLTPSKYAKTQRLERARDLLRHSNMSILDVAIVTGFRSGSYFSHCYVEYFGQPPSAARKGALAEGN